MAKKIYVVEFAYSDQYSRDSGITGVYTDLKAALIRVALHGYEHIYEVVPNSSPMETKPVSKYLLKKYSPTKEEIKAVLTKLRAEAKSKR